MSGVVEAHGCGTGMTRGAGEDDSTSAIPSLIRLGLSYRQFRSGLAEDARQPSRLRHGLPLHRVRKQ